MIYALNLAIDGRILSATHDKFAPENSPRVESLPSGDTDEEKNIHNWLYINSEYIYDPLPEPEQPEPTPTDSERITALEDTITALIGGISDAV